mmetsp:Transcript_12195/g.37186  ORF Transcript_12195/g.37186 Transcript_12195/m.37186 type:complete len:115 (-) Transcript_12195:1888-2232(-)
MEVMPPPSKSASAGDGGDLGDTVWHDNGGGAGKEDVASGGHVGAEEDEAGGGRARDDGGTVLRHTCDGKRKDTERSMDAKGRASVLEGGYAKAEAAGADVRGGRKWRPEGGAVL